VQLTGGFRPQLFLELQEVKRNVTCRSDYNAVVYNPFHSHQPHSSLSDYSVSAEAAEKPVAQTYTRSATLLSGDSPTEHRKPSEKPATAFFSREDRLRLRCLVSLLGGTPTSALGAALALERLQGCHKSPSAGVKGWEPHQWLSQSCPDPVRARRATWRRPNHFTPKLLPALPQTLCLLRGRTVHPCWGTTARCGTRAESHLLLAMPPGPWTSSTHPEPSSTSRHRETLQAQHCVHRPGTILSHVRLSLPIFLVSVKTSPSTLEPKLQSQGAAEGQAHPVVSPAQAGTSRPVRGCTSRHTVRAASRPHAMQLVP